MRLLFDEFAIAAHVDEFAIAALMVVLVVGGMRLSTGRGHGRRGKHGIAPDRRSNMSKRCGEKRRDPATPALRGVGMQLTRAVIVLIATEWFTTIRCRRLCHHFSYQPLLEELAASEKLPIVRRGSLKSSRRKPKQIAETAPLTPGDPDSGDQAAQPKQVAETAPFTTGDSESGDQAAR